MPGVPLSSVVFTLGSIITAFGVSLAGPSPGPIFPTEDATPTSPSEVSEIPLFTNEDMGSKDVEFHIYSRSNPVNAVVVMPGTSWDNAAPPVDLSLDLIVILHGFTGSVMSKSVVLIKNALLFKLNTTVVAVQWAHLAKGPWYDEAAENTLVAAKHLATFLLKLEKSGLHLDCVHIIGFSLGAHVAGLTGSILEGRVGRISGLDPARPGFDFRNNSGRLDSTDARFVLGLHTGAGFVAMLDPVGHADFYPNGGSKQPHCQTEDVPLVCNHFMAFKYFAESIYDPNAFPSCLSSSWEDFEGRECNAAEAVVMGYYTPNNTRGTYYLRTNDQEPYGMNKTNQHVDLDVDQLDSLTKPSVDWQLHQSQDSLNIQPSVESGHINDLYFTDHNHSPSKSVEIQFLDDVSAKAPPSNSCRKSSSIPVPITILFAVFLQLVPNFFLSRTLFGES